MHAKYFLPQIQGLDYVIYYAGLNDVGMWLYKTDFDPNSLDDPDYWDNRIGESFRQSAYTPADHPWYKSLELWKRASTVKSVYLSHRIEDKRQEGAIVEDEHLEWLRTMQTRRQNRPKVFVHRARMETHAAALEAYGRNLKLMIALSRESGVEPIMIAQAMNSVLLTEEERRHMWMGAMDGGKTYIKEEQMRELLEEYNGKMKDVSTEEGVLFIDLPALIQKERGLVHDGVHFNELGARVMARKVTDFLWQTVLAKEKR